MSARELLVIRAFTDDGQGGNPAGVVLDADGLSAAQKQAIAATAGFPETAFVSRSATATYRLEFFTPRRQIAHCGHATIAVFAHLNAVGRLPDGLHSKETIDGLRSVRVADGRAAMEQRPPRVTPVDAAVTLNALRLSDGDVEPGFGPVCIDTGNRFVIVGVRTADRLAAMAPDPAALEDLSEALDLIGAYVFTFEAAAPYAATARMFAPRYGIPEESATGMAAGPLAGLLRLTGRIGDQALLEQGRFMTPSSPSRLDVEFASPADGEVGPIWVAGTATLVERRALPIPEAA